MVVEVAGAEELGLIDEGLLLGIQEALPGGAKVLGDLSIVQVQVLLLRHPPLRPPTIKFEREHTENRECLEKG
ncbi:UNVERIFIED_CONTAM: hypothetical protein K2H54_056405 [Gekko kuhli]